MPDKPADKSWGETYYEEVEALKANDVDNADAIRQVAQKYDKQENAVRGGIHQYKRGHLGNGSSTTTRRRRGAPSVDDLLGNARKSLEEALTLVDREVEEAKSALDAAQKRYDDIAASVKDRKADIEQKLKALA
jgi:transposase-like protein